MSDDELDRYDRLVNELHDLVKALPGRRGRLRQLSLMALSRAGGSCHRGAFDGVLPTGPAGRAEHRGAASQATSRPRFMGEARRRAMQAPAVS
jgi:hypothetical protein